jgi:hypothetical protein
MFEVVSKRNRFGFFSFWRGGLSPFIHSYLPFRTLSGEETMTMRQIIGLVFAGIGFLCLLVAIINALRTENIFNGRYRWWWDEFDRLPPIHRRILER